MPDWGSSLLPNPSPPVGGRRREIAWMGAITLALGLVLYFLPEIDLTAAGLFYAPGKGFYSPTEWWLAVPYYGMPRLGQATFIAILLAWFGSLAWSRLRRWRAFSGFLLCAMILGPHLVVGEFLKEHSGRARPANIQQFGGPQTFTPAFVFTDQCPKNCAFVSGHVASASFAMAFGWLAAPAIRRRWLWGGTAFAAVMGLARMAQGGHFLSDVIFAYLIVYWTLWLVEWLFRRFGWLPRGSSA